ncbi:hypothetical protein BVI2075_780040 [Burkholderia vietnamiensis]|nr:hypothetical protein BVI2075_780040 [Burkholderia vietnamiensis]
MKTGARRLPRGHVYPSEPPAYALSRYRAASST